MESQTNLCTFPQQALIKKGYFFANLTLKVWNAGNFAMKIICVSFLLMLAEKGIATNLNLTRDVMCQLLVHRCRRNKLECRTWCIFQFKFVLRLSRFVNIHLNAFGPFAIFESLAYELKELVISIMVVHFEVTPHG